MVEGQEDVSWPQWVGLAEACERHGIGALYRSDHYLHLDGAHPERGSLDAWGTICGLAAITETVRLGTLVSPATFRHPSALAKLVTTADWISGGRVELGLGAGWHEPEHTAYGFVFADQRTRMDLLAEEIQVVLGNWSREGAFSFHGEFFDLDQLRAEPKPVQQPHPPLILGGNAGPRSCALAAEYADEYNTVFATPAEAADRRARLEEACQWAEREPMPFSVMTAVLAGRDEADLRERAERIAEARGDIDADTLLDDPPHGWIVGTAEQAVEQLLAYAEQGVSRIMCQLVVPDDVEYVELLGGTLQPQVV